MMKREQVRVSQTMPKFAKYKIVPHNGTCHKNNKKQTLTHDDKSKKRENMFNSSEITRLKRRRSCLFVH